MKKQNEVKYHIADWAKPSFETRFHEHIRVINQLSEVSVVRSGRAMRAFLAFPPLGLWVWATGLKESAMFAAPFRNRFDGAFVV